MKAYTELDAIGLFLSGGASNQNPSDSLGGMISSKLIKGMNAVFSKTVQGLIIEDATPENGEGVASIVCDENNNATYTPPDGQTGAPVSIAEGERKVLLGADSTKAVRIQRVSGQLFLGVATFTLVDKLSGVLSMSNVGNAERVAGSTLYRALFAKVLAPLISTSLIDEVLMWITTNGQSTWKMALETPDSTDAIQEISDESVPPIGVDWVEAVSEETALDLDDSTGLDEEEIVGVWLERTFPSSGIVDAKEQVNLHLKYDYEE